MNRIVQGIAVCLFLMGLGICNAEEPYREWLNFFEGKWNVNEGEWSFEFRATRGKAIVYAEITPPEGDAVLAVYAWDANKKALVFTWFDPKGGSVRQEFTVFKGDVMSGLLYGSGPEGATTGSAMVQRFGADKFKVTLKVFDASGQVTEPSVELTRKK